MTRTIGVILAAGVGRRLGGPKALLRWPYGRHAGQLLAAVHARQLLQAGCARVLVVTRANIAQALQGALPAAARTVVSHEADKHGPAGSLRAAARQLGENDPCAFVTPVDAIPVAAEVYAALSRALTPERLAARPRYGRRRGHPVLLRTRLLRAFASGPLPTLRQVLRRAEARCADVPVFDAAVLHDLDTPQHWQQLAQRQGRQPTPALSFAAYQAFSAASVVIADE